MATYFWSIVYYISLGNVQESDEKYCKRYLIAGNYCNPPNGSLGRHGGVGNYTSLLSFLTLWVRSDKSVVSNQPEVGCTCAQCVIFSASMSTH